MIVEIFYINIHVDLYMLLLIKISLNVSLLITKLSAQWFFGMDLQSDPLY